MVRLGSSAIANIAIVCGCHLTQISPMDIPSSPAWISQEHMNFIATAASPVVPSAKLAGSSMAAQGRDAFCTSRTRIWHPHNVSQLSFDVPERWPRDSSLSCGGYEQQPLTSLDALESWITGLYSSFLLPLFHGSFFIPSCKLPCGQAVFLHGTRHI